MIWSELSSLAFGCSAERLCVDLVGLDPLRILSGVVLVDMGSIVFCGFIGVEALDVLAEVAGVTFPLPVRLGNMIADPPPTCSRIIAIAVTNGVVKKCSRLFAYNDVISSDMNDIKLISLVRVTGNIRLLLVQIPSDYQMSLLVPYISYRANTDIRICMQGGSEAVWVDDMDKIPLSPCLTTEHW